MRAVQVAAFGPPEVLHLRELPDVVPGADQIVIAVLASDVLFVDTMIRSGKGADYFPIRPPYVPGNGVGGTVVATGRDVAEDWVGRRVVAHTGGPGGTGGYSELAVSDLENTIEIPADRDILDATAVLHDGTTALRILEVAHVRPDDCVLVLGAAGGMGIVLVQLLAARGAQVVGAAGGKAKQEVVAQAGASAAIDYAEPDWTEAVVTATDGRRPNVVLDGVGGPLGQAAFDLVADGGRISTHGAPSGSFAAIDPGEAAQRSVTVTTIADLQYPAADRSLLTKAILEEVQSGHVTPLVGQTFSLGDARKAHQAIEARETIGKTLLLAGAEPS